MTYSKLFRIISIATLSIMFIALSSTMTAQTVNVEGLIKARSGDTMILKTSDSPKLIVLLDDNTEVGQIQGVLKARRKQMSMAALIPGLKVQVEGTYNDQGQLQAKVVKFKGKDLEEAETIQAGMHESKEQLEVHNAQLKAHEEKISANKTAIDAAVARFGQMDDYYIFDEVTVYFANGKINIDPKYNSQLSALAEKAKTINGYMIQVEGYASAVGSAALNQKLSDDRANNVTQFLQQQCHVPLTRMLAPGAMGESNQVGSNKTAEGQAQNRRVVVRVLQNKGIAGM